MARPERLLDPTAGPLEAFAHDLRGLRREAGNPSYRAMAKSAHYSVATLAEAARGLHKPSLKVTLAYVAACGGDTPAWARRWHDVSEKLEAEQTEARRQAEPVPREPTRPGRPAVRPPGPEPSAPKAPGPNPSGAIRSGVSRPAANPPGSEPHRSDPYGSHPHASHPQSSHPYGAERVPRQEAGPPRQEAGPAAPRATLSPGSVAVARPADRGEDALTADERDELRRLRDEVAELRRVNEVLKAASAIFAADLRTTAQVVYNPTGRQDRSA
jgi:hypothetical protein